MKNYKCIALVLLICAVAANHAAGQQVITPVSAGLVNTPLDVVNNTNGDQTDPRVSLISVRVVHDIQRRVNETRTYRCNHLLPGGVVSSYGAYQQYECDALVILHISSLNPVPVAPAGLKS